MFAKGMTCRRRCCSKAPTAPWQIMQLLFLCRLGWRCFTWQRTPLGHFCTSPFAPCELGSWIWRSYLHKGIPHQECGRKLRQLQPQLGFVGHHEPSSAGSSEGLSHHQALYFPPKAGHRDSNCLQWEQAAPMSSGKPGLQLAENWHHHSNPLPTPPSHPTPHLWRTTPVADPYCPSWRCSSIEEPKVRGSDVFQEIFLI